MAVKQKTFEEAMARLEEIVGTLEDNKQPLDQMIELFEEGLKLVQTCDERLRSFEKKIEEISRQDDERESV